MASNKEILSKLRPALQDLRTWMKTPDFHTIDLSHEWLASLGVWLETSGPNAALEYHQLRRELAADDAGLGDLEDFLVEQVAALEAKIEAEACIGNHASVPDTSPTNEAPEQHSQAKTIKQRLEESILWVALGMFGGGFLVGMTVIGNIKEAQVESLKAQNERLKDELHLLEKEIAQNDAKGDSAVVVHVDDPQITSGTTARVRSPILVTWEAERNRVVHVYKNGTLLFPLNDPHEEHASGVRISLEPGLYELKLWDPGAKAPYKSIWVEIAAAP